MKPEKTTGLQALQNGLLAENPLLRLMLGVCPALAVTATLPGGLAMGLVVALVLLLSAMAVSALRKWIPPQVSLPSYMVIIATFATLAQMLVMAYLPDIGDLLGVYLPLVTVNCIILGRVETVAAKSDVLASALDALGMGVGFTVVMSLIGAVRELLGRGSLFGVSLFPAFIPPFAIVAQPAGGLFIFGCFVALAVYIDTLLGKRKKKKAERATVAAPAKEAEEDTPAPAKAAPAAAEDSPVPDGKGAKA